MVKLQFMYNIKIFLSLLLFCYSYTVHYRCHFPPNLVYCLMVGGQLVLLYLILGYGHSVHGGRYVWSRFSTPTLDRWRCTFRLFSRSRCQDFPLVLYKVYNKIYFLYSHWKQVVLFYLVITKYQRAVVKCRTFWSYRVG